jgi:hypothetical protein
MKAKQIVPGAIGLPPQTTRLVRARILQADILVRSVHLLSILHGHSKQLACLAHPFLILHISVLRQRVESYRFVVPTRCIAIY